jgi:hypothetical protein
MSVDFSSWPVLPLELRPKKLFHCGEMDGETREALEGAGWKVIDIRTLPEGTDDEKVEAIKCWLQGVRLGSIQPGRGDVRFSELEARVYGLCANKRPEKAKEPMNDEDLAGILGPLASNKGKK